MTFDYEVKIQCGECGRWNVVAVDSMTECDVCGAVYRVEVEQVTEGDSR